MKKITKFKSLKLDEATRSQLINKSRNADDYSLKNQSKGKNRYERRTRSRIASSVSQFNKIDMDAFFKRDILTVGIEVHGETNDYIVTMRFKDVLKEIQRDVKANNGKLEFKIIAKAMSRAFNTGDIQINCSCPDGKFRQNYWQWKNGTGTRYEPRPSDKTNPYDTKGAGCKHTLLVLSNLDWMMKVASVINNYIKYCQQNLQNNYATYMFPKIYGMPYNKAVQLSLFDTGLLPSDQETLSRIASTNLKDKDARGRFIAGNKFRFPSSNKERPSEDEEQGFNIEKDRKGGTVLTYPVNRDRNNMGRFIKGNTMSSKEEPTFKNGSQKSLTVNDDENQREDTTKGI